MSAHAKLSPSGAHRWAACPGSVVLEAEYPDTSSAYADEGTAAHTLASWCLEDGMDADSYTGLEITAGERRFTVDADMAAYVQDYVKLVRDYARQGALMVEQRVPITSWTYEEDAGGTADAVIVDIERQSLIVVDLKYGMGVRVSADDNPQLLLYALGAHEAFGVLSDFTEITMVIHQPRLNHVSEWTISYSALRAFGDELRRAAEAVQRAQRDSLGVADHLQPGEKQCRFCKAKASCPALRAEVSEIVGGDAACTVEDFAEFLPEPVDSLIGDNYLSMAMAKVGLVEDWCKAIRAEVERRLLAGKSVEGFKLVEGKRGNRKWSDAKAVEGLLKSFRMRQDEMYALKLISPTAAEKLFKSNPKRWAKVQEHVVQDAGKPSVAFATDKRQAIAVQPVGEDFAGLFQAEN